MCINTKHQKEKSKATTPKAFLNAQRNKTTNKTKAFINAHIYTRKKEEEKKRKQHHTSKRTTIKAFINAQSNKTTNKTKASINAYTYKTEEEKKTKQHHKAFINVHTHKHNLKQQQNHPQNIQKILNINQIITTYITNKHKLTKLTLHTQNKTQLQQILHMKNNKNIQQQARPTGLAQTDNTPNHYTPKDPKHPKANIYKTTSKQKKQKI